MKNIFFISISVICILNSGCASHLARGFGTHHYLVPNLKMLYPGVQTAIGSFSKEDKLNWFYCIDFPFSFAWDTMLLIPDLINAPFDDFGECTSPLDMSN